MLERPPSLRADAHMRKGRRIARVVTAVTAAAVLCGGAAAATTVRIGTHHKASGTVASVNGTTAPGICGTVGVAGDFTVTAHSTTDVVDVGSATTFQEHGVAAPSFADVCVGDKVRAAGTITANDIVAAISVRVIPPRPERVSGTVASVNGATAAGTCGTAGGAGDFTVTAHSTTDTVDVGSSTTFQEHGVAAPSFADVCVGDKVRVAGPISSSHIVTATKVIVIPPRPERVSGTAASVNGTTAAGACGTAGGAGDFTVTAHSATDMVDVGSATTFQDHGVASPSFADVCVGDKVRATVTMAGNDIVTATKVTVVPPRPQRVSGTVASVNGTTTAGACGTAGGAGGFTLTSPSTTDTVEVGSATTFRDHGVASPSFADVCVGDKVRAAGTISPSHIVTATKVTVVPPRRQRVSGTVASVNGRITCGTAGIAGDFTLTSNGTTYTVDVGPTATIFKEHGVPAPSFADVCAGDNVRATGSILPNDVVPATNVVVTMPSS